MSRRCFLHCHCPPTLILPSASARSTTRDGRLQRSMSRRCFLHCHCPPTLILPLSRQPLHLRRSLQPAAHARSSCLQSRSTTEIYGRASACGGIPFLASPGCTRVSIG